MPKVTRKSGRPRGNGGEIERREISECEAQEGEAWTQHCQGFGGAVLNVPWRVHRPSEEERPLGCGQQHPPTGRVVPLAWAWPLVATLGRKSRLTHNPTLHCGPHPCLVVDTGCRAEGGRLRGSGYVGATGPAKLVLEARLVCGCLWVLLFG